jgi:peptidoglycan/LPS O-acetylase OafA/YrhL
MRTTAWSSTTRSTLSCEGKAGVDRHEPPGMVESAPGAEGVSPDGSTTSPPGGRAAKVLALTAGRDRVLDFVKTFALLAVVIGHSLAWDVSTGSPGNVLEDHPELTPLTWLFQVLPLFFAAGAVSNLASWQNRGHDPGAFRRHRLVRLVTPLVLYSVVWTLVLLVPSLSGGEVVDVGRFLSQLTWFLGVYALVVVAVPVTARWTARPWLTLSTWLLVVLLVDLVRWRWAPGVGWVNFVIVWAWIHQLGYQLPRLRQASRAVLGIGAAAAAIAALALALAGPYSSSMISVGGDAEMSNLAPPTVVLVLLGLAQVLLLAALWPALAHLLENSRVWIATATIGSRAMGIYLWHIPLVGLVVLPIWLSPMALATFSWQWWAIHLVGLVVVLAAAWMLAGLAGRVERRLQRWGAHRATVRAGREVAVPVVPIVILNASVTGFATVSGAGMLGLPSSSVVNLALLVACWLLIVGEDR